MTLLSGGVGGARLARGLDAVLPTGAQSVVVNVGDDEGVHGVHVSADLDTVTYTLAGIEGPHGWGIAGDRFTVMDHLAALGEDTRFRLGDRDLAVCLYRTARLHEGVPLSTVTASLAAALGVGSRILPASDDRVRTVITTSGGERLSFQEYFVLRRHADEVMAVEYEGADAAKPAPGVLEAIADADLVVIAPSNPPLSIWPILAVPGMREALLPARVVAVSPLFAGKALKGPADRVMASLGLPAGNAGVLAAYEGLVDLLVVDTGDAGDTALSSAGRCRVVAADTRIADPGDAARFARLLLELAGL